MVIQKNSGAGNMQGAPPGRVRPPGGGIGLQRKGTPDP